MAWAVPEHSRKQVNRAGATLIAPTASLEERGRARQVVNNWRAAHSFPLNTLQVNLRRHVSDYGDEALVAQRLKRLSSIEDKLRRFPRMRLSRVQDIGGCRAVLPSAADVRDVVRTFERSRARHELLRTSDYLVEPRESGYRGVHLIYAYRSGSERNAVYDGMQVEIQLRSRLQHAWATAVETVGIFSGEALKSSEGNKRWLDFFALMGTEIACTEELPPVPGTPADREVLRRKLRRAADRLDAIAKLRAYGNMLRVLEGDVRNGKAAYFHIQLELQGDDWARVRWNEYAENEREVAIRAYEEVESANRYFPGAETVLVRVSSVEALRRAYPNYFADTRVFVAELEKALA